MSAGSPVLHLTGPLLVGDAEAGHSEVRPEAWVVGGRLTYTRPVSPGADMQTVPGWVIPGLVDMHCHVSIGPDGPVDLAAARTYAKAEARAGVLLARDAGSTLNLESLRDLPDGPRLIRSGRFIARHKRYLPGLAVTIEPHELPAEVGRQAARGDGWVKIVADWIDRDLGDAATLTPLWEPHQLREALAVAHAAGARVTAHTFSEEAITPLLDAGIDSIEHGTGMTAEHAARAAAAGVPVVPTLRQVGNFAAFAAQAGSKYPVYAATMTRMHARRYTHVRELFEAGVTLLLGSDGGTSITHAEPVREALEMAQAIPAADVVAGATWRARRFLGAGVLDEGDPADLLVLDADPRLDVSELGRPRAIVRSGMRLA